MEREYIEWSNNWWEAACNSEKDRIALIGDSVTRGFRGSFNESVSDSFAVDLCASSATITDGLLQKEIRFFFEEGGYKYKIIMLNIGMQHGFLMQCHLKEEDCRIYRKQYRELANLVKKYCDKLFFVSGTPTVHKENLKKFNIERNAEIRKRNEIVRGISSEYGGEYIDLFSFLEDEKYVHIDWIHFDKETNKEIGKFLADYVRPRVL